VRRTASYTLISASPRTVPEARIALAGHWIRHRTQIHIAHLFRSSVMPWSASMRLMLRLVFGTYLGRSR